MQNVTKKCSWYCSDNTAEEKKIEHKTSTEKHASLMTPFFNKNFYFCDKNHSGRRMHINTHTLNRLMLYRTLFRYRIENGTPSSLLGSWPLLCSIQCILTCLVGPDQNLVWKFQLWGKTCIVNKEALISILAFKKKEGLTSRFYKYLWAEIIGVTFFLFYWYS